MTISYLSGNEDTIIMNLGGSAVATHAKKHGITEAESYQIRSKKSEVTALKKEYPTPVGLDNMIGNSKRIMTSEGIKEASIRVVPLGSSQYGEVGIKVNNSYSIDSNISREDGIKIALATRRMFNEIAKKMPDGTVLTNMPTTGDGKGDGRRKLYMAAGFSKGSNSESMMAIVKNGKLKPITREIIKKLQSSNS